MTVYHYNVRGHGVVSVEGESREEADEKLKSAVGPGRSREARFTGTTSGTLLDYLGEETNARIVAALNDSTERAQARVARYGDSASKTDKRRARLARLHLGEDNG